jgi:Transposase
MKRGRFAEEQIIAVLREHEAGAKTGELARKHGISEATLYNWKAKYGSMDVSKQATADARRRERQAEEAAGGIDARQRRAQGASGEKMVGPAVKRDAVAHLRDVLQMSERRACSLVAADRKMIRYRSRRRQTRSCAPVCTSLPINGGVSAIVACTSCCATKASHPASIASTGSIARRD